MSEADEATGSEATSGNSVDVEAAKATGAQDASRAVGDRTFGIHRARSDDFPNWGVDPGVPVWVVSDSQERVYALVRRGMFDVHGGRNAGEGALEAVRSAYMRGFRKAFDNPHATAPHPRSVAHDRGRTHTP